VGKVWQPGLEWTALAAYYKKSYTLFPPEDQETLDHLGIDWIDEKYRGTDGPIQVSFPGVLQNPLCKAWIDDFRGLDKVTTGGMLPSSSLHGAVLILVDPSSGKSIGGYSNVATVDPVTKTRSYAGSAYGIPTLQDPTST